MLLSVIVLTLFGGSVALLARGLMLDRTRTAERMRDIDAYGVHATAAALPSPSVPQRSFVTGIASALGNVLAARVRGFKPEEVRREIVAAGLYKLTPGVLLGYQAMGLLLGAALLFWLANDGGTTSKAVFTLLGAGIGWVTPMAAIKRRARFRLDSIDRALPDLIDLLTVTVEAGLGLGASLKLAAERTKGPLGDELQIVMQEQRIGRSLAEALESMLERADTPSTRSFVRSVAQGESLGVSIGTMMRNLAGEMRKRRRASVEERAQKTPVKILFPLVFLILPALMIVVLAPALMSLAESLN